jgi:hypothetical protein
MPVCIWECWECFEQFYMVANDPPHSCPSCLKVGKVHFVDNIEFDKWRPKARDTGDSDGEH